jgi:hypothetical protein
VYLKVFQLFSGHSLKGRILIQIWYDPKRRIRIRTKSFRILNTALKVDRQASIEEGSQAGEQAGRQNGTQAGKKESRQEDRKLESRKSGRLRRYRHPITQIQ